MNRHRIIASRLGGWLALLGSCILLAQQPDLAPVNLTPASTNAPANSTNAPPTEPYDPETRELRIRDTFRYRIEEDPAKSSDPMRVTITDSGEAHFSVTQSDSSYITLRVAGKKLGEVRSELKQRLDADYYLDCTVSLDLEGINTTLPGGANPLTDVPHVVVFGELSGTFPIPEGKKLMLSEIMLRMPRNDFARMNKVEIQRLGPDGKPIKMPTVDVERLLRENDRSLDVELKEGDRVRVPRKVLIGL